MQIKELNKKYFNDCVEVFRGVFSLAPWNEEWTSDQIMERLECIFDTPFYTGFFIEESSSVLGFCMGNSEPYMGQHVFLLREMCVRPDYQGNGLGSMLISNLEKYLVSKGISNLYLSTKSGSNAEKFYLNHKYIKNESECIYEKSIIN